MISPSSFSLVALHLRQILADGINDIDISSITISNPKDRNKDEGKDIINLFFYKIDYGGFPSDGNIENPMYVRLYCLITPYAADVADDLGVISISHGEKDLRLIGGVMNVLHQTPVFQVNYDAGVIQYQAVIQQLSLDDINHIWSTQGEVPYRLSMAYEFALAPVPLSEITETSPRVSSTGVKVIPNTTVPELPENGFDLRTSSPLVERVEVNTKIPDWEPHICFVDDKDTLSYAAVLPHDSVSGKRNLKIIVAGKQENKVHIQWEIWTPWDSESKKGGWSKPVDDIKHSTFTLPKNKNSFKVNAIDPANINDDMKVVVELPIELPISIASDDDKHKKARRQAIIYVTQKWVKNKGSRQEQQISVISNPLLVTVYYKKGV